MSVNSPFKARATFAAALLLCACASAPEQQVAAIGKVTGAIDMAAVPGYMSAGSRAATQATGGAVAVALVSMFGKGAEPAHTIYVVETSDGKTKYVRSKQKFAVGDCVSVLTSAALIAEDGWKLGEASLKGSTDCKA